MSQTLHYKDHNGSVVHSGEDEILHGRILGIRDVVTFEGKSIKKLQANFEQAVVEYLSFCEAEGKIADVPEHTP